MQKGNSHMHIQQDPQHKSIHQNPLWVLTAQLLVFWVHWFNFPAGFLSTPPYTCMVMCICVYELALIFMKVFKNMEKTMVKPLQIFEDYWKHIGNLVFRLQ